MNKDSLEYRDSAAELRGVLVADDSAAANRPGIILFPDARGIGSQAIACAERLAKLGFVVLVADLYGGGKTVPEVPQAIELMNALRANTARWRERAEAARSALARLKAVDAAKLAAIGYCFGGSTALELARTGANLGAVVSFHGGFPNERPEDATNIRARVLLCHGAADTLVSLTQLAAFEQIMSRTKVDWQVHVYGGAPHGFTNPELMNDNVPNLGYHAMADCRSWAAMLGLLEEAFGLTLR